MTLQHFDAGAVRNALPFPRAIRAIEDGLRNGTDPETASPRIFSPAPDGEFLIMPVQGSAYSGVKVLTLAPRNSSRGLPKIQGVFQLFDTASLAPLCTMDAAELTSIRTPATTITAVTQLYAAGQDPREDPAVLVFGTGVQARSHIEAAHSAFPRASFAVVGRDATRRAGLVRSLQERGIRVMDATDDVDRQVRGADIILCCTSSPVPLFDGTLPHDGAVVAAIGQHGSEAREVDEALVLRSDVVVEGRAASWAENGNLLQARGVDEWKAIAPPNLADLVRDGMRRRPGACALYTGAGMAWEDLLTAVVVYEEGSPSCR